MIAMVDYPEVSGCDEFGEWRVGYVRCGLTVERFVWHPRFETYADAASSALLASVVTPTARSGRGGGWCETVEDQQ